MNPDPPPSTSVGTPEDSQLDRWTDSLYTAYSEAMGQSTDRDQWILPAHIRVLVPPSERQPAEGWELLLRRADRLACRRLQREFVVRLDRQVGLPLRTLWATILLRDSEVSTLTVEAGGLGRPQGDDGRASAMAIRILADDRRALEMAMQQRSGGTPDAAREQAWITTGAVLARKETTFGTDEACNLRYPGRAGIYLSQVALRVVSTEDESVRVEVLNDLGARLSDGSRLPNPLRGLPGFNTPRRKGAILTVAAGDWLTFPQTEDWVRVRFG